mgnify:CR=1 FL=1
MSESSASFEDFRMERVISIYISPLFLLIMDFMDSMSSRTSVGSMADIYWREGRSWLGCYGFLHQLPIFINYYLSAIAISISQGISLRVMERSKRVISWGNHLESP